MWARMIEFMLACWLALSRFIFGYDEWNWIANDLVCAFLLAFFSLGSFFPKLDKIHLCHYFIVVWFIYLAYSHGNPLPPFLQNYLVLAWVFLMTAIIPSHAHLPPRPWQEFILNKKKR